MRLLIIIMSLLLSITSWANNDRLTPHNPLPAQQQQQLLRQASLLVQEQRYSKAIEIYSLLDKQHNTKAQYALGMMHLNGQGTPKDPKLAITYLTQAASNNNPDALYQLGILTTEGIGTVADPEKGMTWFQSAAKLGQKEARHRVGFAAATGTRMAKNETLAYEYLLPFAREDDVKAQYIIGQIGLASDQEEQQQQGEQFMIKAAENGNALAALTLGKAYQTGDVLPQNHYQAFFWFNKAVAANNADAVYYLAEMYEQGIGTESNQSKAIQLFDRASTEVSLSPKLTNQLAQRYLTGNPMPKDEEAAIRLLKVAATGGNQNAQLQVANLYREKNNIPEAVKWYTKAAEQGNEQSQYFLGYFYHTGTKDIAIDYHKSLHWYQRAANNGNVDSMYMLGYQYYHGQGSPENDAEAYTWFKKAAYLGNANAQLMLAILYQEGKVDGQQDSVKAYAWLLITAAASEESIITQAEGYLEQLQQHLSRNQINQGRQLAQTYFSDIEQPLTTSTS